MSKAVFLVIAGTVYGRKLSYELAEGGATVYATVATDYAQGLYPPRDNLTILPGRLSTEQMETLIKSIKPSAVINTAHPYAVEVSENIKAACENTDTYYLRLIRDENIAEGVIYVKAIEEAAEFLSDKEGNIFSTCGSKELKKLTLIKGYKDRVYIRALPMEDLFKKCIELGFSPSKLICMQGPFSKELNIAMLRDTEAKYLITKNSGNAGGFNEKIEAANELGITTVVIGRPPQQSGYYYNEIIDILENSFNIKIGIDKTDEQGFFPMFVSLKNKKVLVIGAGNIAKRRIATLKNFGCEIHVIATENRLQNSDGIKIYIRKYQAGDCIGADMVVAATNNKEVNKKIADECKGYKIPVSVCDDKSLCSFYFPSVIIKENIVIGVTSSGTDHKKVKTTADNIRNNINSILGS